MVLVFRFTDINPESILCIIRGNGQRFFFFHEVFYVKKTLLPVLECFQAFVENHILHVCDPISRFSSTDLLL